MLSQTDASGFGQHHILADDKQAPNFSEVDEGFAVCTDDVMHWARTIPLACDRLAKPDVQWGRSGIARRPDEDIDWSLKVVPLDVISTVVKGSFTPTAENKYKTLTIQSLCLHVVWQAQLKSCM